MTILTDKRQFMIWLNIRKRLFSNTWCWVQEERMIRIAIYGKGGIGKSTIAANISAILGKRGLKVLQIGCDPKHDSTMLLDSSNKETLLDIVANGCREGYLTIGKYGVHCIEIGGPKPGVGCAGRGIICGTSFLREEGILGDYDCILYDVLGDVVCGGFFQPLKENLVDTMFIVTSGEFNSIFAANNLCKGYINSQLNARNVKLGGIIGNCRGIYNEKEILLEFSNRINVPLLGIVPRDIRIEESTFEGNPIIEKEKNGDLISIFSSIANIIVANQFRNELPNPMELEELRKIYEKTYR